jgi:ABC-type phosphate transport system substrate-binding protein
MVTIDATADAAGRAVYGAAGVAIAPQVVLRAGLPPVTRPNGSGAGIGAINNDAAHSIDFVRSSRLPKPTEQGVSVASAATATSLGTPAGGSLHVFRLAVDGLQMATASTTNAPANITCADIVGIYKGTITNWSQVTGSTTSGVIVPFKPQTGSGTLGDFETVLKSCNAGVAVTYGAAVLVSEEHDPAVIAGNANAIAPFSTGRYNLLQGNGTTGYLSTYTPGAIKLQGTPTVGTTTTSTSAETFYQARNLYVIVRDADIASTIPMQVGGANNWVKTLFGTTTAYAAKASNSALFTAAGVVQSYADLGIVSA